MPILAARDDESVFEAPSHMLPKLEAEQTSKVDLTQKALYEHDGTVRGRPARTEGQMMGDLAIIAALGSVKEAREFVKHRRDLHAEHGRKPGANMPTKSSGSIISKSE